MGVVAAGIGVAIVIKAGLAGMGYKIYKDSNSSVKIKRSRIRKRRPMKRNEALLLKSKERPHTLAQANKEALTES